MKKTLFILFVATIIAAISCAMFWLENNQPEPFHTQKTYSKTTEITCDCKEGNLIFVDGKVLDTLMQSYSIDDAPIGHYSIGNTEFDITRRGQTLYVNIP